MEEIGREEELEKSKKFRSRLQANLDQKHRGKRDTKEIVLKASPVKSVKKEPQKFEITIDTVEQNTT